MVRHHFWRALIAFILLSTAACAHVISSEMREAARKGLSFPAMLENPAAYIGSTVILGGVVIETKNRPDGTMITVLETPLDSQGRPRDERLSRGRFLAHTSAYLDPEIYKKGKGVTLAGEIIGREIRPIGEIHYGYPLISIQEIHLVESSARRYFFPSIGIGFGYVHH